jgi:uncharacterized repeat protein (TIGR01451 family)
MGSLLRVARVRVGKLAVGVGIGCEAKAALARGRRRARIARSLALPLLLAPFATAAVADPLVISNVGAPTQVGAGQGKRAIWTNAGTVGGQAIDIVATLTTATQNHNFTASGNRPSVTSVGQDNVWVEWRIFEAGTHDINTDSGGVPVAADVHVQLNDIDGPNNERAYIPACNSSVAWVRIDQAATTGRAFGTVAGVPEIFSVIGDQNYNSEPQSGVEILYPSTSTFTFGRTADNMYFIRLDNPSYDEFNTIDFQCADLKAPVAVADTGEGEPGDPVVINILDNDSAATNNPSGVPSEWARLSVNLATPGGAAGVLTDAGGDVYQFTVAGQGTWNYDESDGELTFTPQVGFTGTVTPITYTFDNALGATSNAAGVTVEYPAIGIIKSGVLNDNIHADGHGQVGETIAYTYQVSVIGGVAVENVTVTETGFTGAGAVPAPAYQAGDVNANNRLDPGETWTYAATYTIVAADLVAGSVENQATAAGATASGTPVSDLSDSTNAADGNGVGTPGGGANNDDATVSTLTAAPIDAVDDAPAPVNGADGEPSVVDVIDNDTLDGAAADPARLTVTVVTPAAHAGVTLNTGTGVVSVAAGTPAATYTIVYRICETLSPANCDTATVTVEVEASAIDAVDDAPAAVGGIAGEPNLVNVLTNDTLNGAAAAIGDLTLTVVTPSGHAGVTLNTGTGVVSVAAATPAGTYTIRYRICENLNPTNCDEADVTVIVGAAAIDAVNDTVATPVDTAHAVTGAVQVLTNDTLGGAAANVGNVNVSASGALPAGFTLTMQGAVDIAQGTATGSYSFDYRICEILNPANCDTATVRIEVRKTVPSISGTVFFDANGNGTLDGNEQRLAGYRVELRRAGSIVKQTTSDAQGDYHLYDFDPGSGYEVVFIDPATEVAVGRIANLTFAVDGVLEHQNQPIDPSGVVYNVITGAPLAGATIEMRTASGATLPDVCVLPGQQRQTTQADGRYRFDVVPGAHALCPAVETEYRLVITAFPSGMEPTLSQIAPPETGALDATTCPADAVPGGACQLSADVDAPAGGAPTRYYLAFLLAPGDPNVVNNHIPLDPLPSIPATGLSVTKRASVAVARRDEVVSYVIVAANDNPTAAGPLDVVDRLPPGFAYVPGSARLDGAEVEPVVSGRTLTFARLRLPARGSVEIRLTTRIGADVVPGEQVNEAWMANPANGQVLTALARAVVRVVAEHVFDCGDVTGKVFDDRNRDGRQDTGEKGLPAVRVVTVNGMLITTDKHGRFSVPCAALPDQAIGSNFILKLDPRTLPQGFAVTTENPRVVRLTAGKATTINFGATAGRVVDVEITGRAFRQGSARPSAELAAGIGQLGELTDKRAAVLTIVYRAGSEPEGLRAARVEAVRHLLAQVWRDGRKALPFEVRVVGGGG